MAVARLLTRQRRHVETRSRALERQVQQWLRRYAQRMLSKEMARKKVVSKAGSDLDTRALEKLLRDFGLRQIQEAGQRTSGVTPDQQNRLVDDFLKTKTVLVQGIARDVRAAVRRSIRTVIRDALREVPKPSAGEIALRIRTQYHGPVDKMPMTIGSGRAALIARTELAQAENTGIVAGYNQTGVTHLEWLSYTDDRSGDRHHESMNGEVIRIGGHFKTHLGNRLRYPGDPKAPIKETAN